MKTKHFTVLEAENSEYSMIGTLLNVKEIDLGNGELHKRLVTALEEHFDAEVEIERIPDLFNGYNVFDAVVNIKDAENDTEYTAKIELKTTWTY